MFNAKVYTTAIISLSGVMEETYAAKEAVQQWNQQHAVREGKLFLPVDDAQAADVVIAVVGGWIDRAEQIEQCLNAGKKVMLLFNAYSDPKNTIPSEQTAVAEYMRQMLQRCICAEYNGAAQLSRLIIEQLEVI